MARPSHYGPHINYEQEVDLNTAIDTIAQTVALLKKDGELKVSQHGQNFIAKPATNVAYVFKYETLPHGEFALKFEIKWLPGGADAPPPRDTPFKIEGLS
jgi:hypothetical protein